MPYYGSGIMERNVNTLRGMAQDKETSEVNALKKKETTLKINAVIRKQVMESRWIAGQYLNSVVDDPSYQKVKEAAKKNGTDISEWPTTFEKDFIERELAENNIRYQALGKGELLKVPMYRMNKDGTKETQEVVDNSPQFFRMLKGESGEPWKQGKLIAKPEPKLYETTEGYQTATNAIGKSKPTDMDAGEGTETERYAKQHNITLLEAKRKIKLATQIGMSDDDKRSYDIQDDRAYRTENEIRKLKSELAGIPTLKEGENDFFKPKRDLLKEYEKLLVRHEKKRQDILDKYNKGNKTKGAGEFKIPQATYDHWAKQGKSRAEVDAAYEKKYGKNPPKIGF